MSSGPVFTGTELCKHAKPWTSVNIVRDDFCTYKGKCQVWRNIVDLCVHCKYKKLLDIPRILEKRRQ